MVISHVLTSPFLLIIVIGLIAMLNKRRIMGEHVNTWKENLVLVIVALLVCAAAAQGFAQVLGF